MPYVPIKPDKGQSHIEKKVDFLRRNCCRAWAVTEVCRLSSGMYRVNIYLTGSAAGVAHL